MKDMEHLLPLLNDITKRLSDFTSAFSKAVAERQEQDLANTIDTQEKERDITHEHLLEKGWKYMGSAPVEFNLYELRVLDFRRDYLFQIIYRQGVVTGLACKYKDILTDLRGARGLEGEIAIMSMEHLHREIQNLMVL